jgi:uncharacterized membrane protein YczE
MRSLIKRILRLFAGLFLYAVGIVMTINANIGLSPWDVFHQGLSKNVHITMGQASISMGILIVVINSILGERIGWGTISNMLFIGIFMDILMINNIIPVFENIILKLGMMFIGMFVIGTASFLYISTGFGSGPRDGLMIALTKRTGKSVRFIRNCIEVSVLAVGATLGGSLGIGTPIMAFTIGPAVQLAFKLYKFDVSKIKHRFIDEDIKYMRTIIQKPEAVESDNC